MSQMINQIYELYQDITNLSNVVLNLCVQRETFWIVNNVSYVYNPLLENEISIVDDISFHYHNLFMQRDITTYMNKHTPDSYPKVMYNQCFPMRSTSIVPTQQVPTELYDNFLYKVHLYNNLLGSDEILMDLFGSHNAYINHKLDYIQKIQNYSFDDFLESNFDTSFLEYHLFQYSTIPVWEEEYDMYELTKLTIKKLKF